MLYSVVDFCHTIMWVLLSSKSQIITVLLSVIIDSFACIRIFWKCKHAVYSILCWACSDSMFLELILVVSCISRLVFFFFCHCLVVLYYGYSTFNLLWIISKVYKYLLPLKPPSHPPPRPAGLAGSTRLSSLCYTEAYH